MVEEYRFKEDRNEKIIYNEEMIKKNERDEERKFIDLIESDEGKEIIKEKGFVGDEEDEE